MVCAANSCPAISFHRSDRPEAQSRGGHGRVCEVRVWLLETSAPFPFFLDPERGAYRASRSTARSRDPGTRGRSCCSRGCSSQAGNGAASEETPRNWAAMST